MGNIATAVMGNIATAVMGNIATAVMGNIATAVMDNIAAGVPREKILRSYPALQQADIDAALAYAAELAREGAVDLSLEITA